MATISVSGGDGSAKAPVGWAARAHTAALAIALVGCADDGGAQTMSGSTSLDATTGSTMTPPTATSPADAGETSGIGGTGSSEGSDGSDGSDGDDGSSDTTGTPGSDDGGDSPIPSTLCGSPAPAGAEAPPPLPTYTGAMCPPIVPGVNNIASSGAGRELIFVAPSDLKPGETLPLIFLWHWLGGDADDFLEKAKVQEATDQFRFAAVIPKSKGDVLFQWPFSLADSDARLEEELVFFDDMLACVAASYPIDRDCVSSAGVSAGALLTSQLGWARGEYLSSIISLSGGVGGGLIKPWGGSPHVMPAMVLWGGRTDLCIALDFEQTSYELEEALVADGHPIMECVHNCGHSEPPFESPLAGVTDFAAMWRFFLDHPYWLEDGETPYAEGLPEGSPEWCAMGPGSAIIRVGECGGSGC